MTATDELRRMLDERGVEWSPSAWDRSTETYWKTADGNGCLAIQGETKLRLSFADYFTPEQAIEATLGRGTWVNPAWERWHKSLRHDEIKSIGDAVEQLMYEVIEFGGYMGPNGNTYNGIDEGDVLTAGFINEWVERFEATLGGDLRAENAKLRELVRDMWREGMCECGSLGKCATCMYEYPTRMRELGIEVDA